VPVDVRWSVPTMNQPTWGHTVGRRELPNLWKLRPTRPYSDICSHGTLKEIWDNWTGMRSCPDEHQTVIYFLYGSACVCVYVYIHTYIHTRSLYICMHVYIHIYFWKNRQERPKVLIIRLCEHIYMFWSPAFHSATEQSKLNQLPCRLQKEC